MCTPVYSEVAASDCPWCGSDTVNLYRDSERDLYCKCMRCKAQSPKNDNKETVLAVWAAMLALVRNF